MKKEVSLKVSAKICLIFLLFSSTISGQSLELDLKAGSVCLFSGNLYAYGIIEEATKTRFVIHRIGPALEKKDSLSLPVSFGSNKDQASCWADTLHGSLNLYVPEGKQRVSLFRFNKRFELIKQGSNIEVTRLSPLSGFDNELFYDGPVVYAVKTKSDSTGKQFYLNKYQLKSEFTSFEYEPLWQFPFERKNVGSARVFYADKRVVMMFVMVKTGEKTGQWILKVNARNGQLLRGTKLNGKSEDDTYFYGTHFLDPNKKSLLLVGHKYSPKQMHRGSEVLAVTSMTSVGLYFSEIDSLGELVLRQEIKLPVVEPKSSGKKEQGNYVLQIKAIERSQPDEYSMAYDIYRCATGTACYLYANSSQLKFKKEEEKFTVSKNTVSAEPMIASYLFSNDKLDMNGKICPDQDGIGKVLYSQPSSPLKLLLGEDSLKKPFWVLGKSQVRKGNVQYSLLKAGKKSYEMKPVEDVPMAQSPLFIAIDNRMAVIGRQNEPLKYKLILRKF